MQVTESGYVGSLATIVLAVSFIPLAILAAKIIFPILKPPKHRPFVFFLSGICLFMVGVVIVYSLRTELQTGVLHFTSQRYGDTNANASVEPLKFWFIILSFYIVGVISSGFGLAGFRLCFRKDQE